MEDIKILIAEDEAITAMDIKKRLQKLGYNVFAISDTGEDAVKCAKELHPNVVLMDIVLKGKMDGTQAAQEISKYCHVPIIFITAFKDDDSFNRAKLSIPYGYLTKPFETRDLRNAIELALYKHRTESQINAAEKRYRSVMENATCGIFICDKNGIISDFNKQIEKIFGCAREEIIGTNFRNFIPSVERDYTNVQIQKLLLEKTIGPNEVHIQQQNGNIRDVEFSAVYVENHLENFIFCILTDTTERNNLRSQTLLANKLATVGTLAAGIIHEINNPLIFVLTNLNYINENIQQQKLSKIIQESTQGVQKIQKIINDLKRFTRSDPNELALVNIHEVLDSAINMAHSQFKNHAHLEKKYASDVSLLLLNSGKLHQVFLNLLINAAQAMENPDYQKNIITVSTYKKHNQICIDISDTGKGIDSQLLPKIFEPFFTTKPIGIGTGLGLSICYEIIHGFGGEITVHSELEKGTIFSISLPINLIPEPSDNNTNEIKLIVNKKILIVDDEETLLITLERILGEENQITKAQGGRAALELLAKKDEHFDFVISDLHMPDVNGIDLFRFLTEHNPTLAQNMIFITGGFYNSAMTEFISKITNPCLQKPFTKEQLFQSLNMLLVEEK